MKAIGVFIMAILAAVLQMLFLFPAQAYTVTGTGSYNHSPSLIVDGFIPPQGSGYGADACVYWSGTGVTLTVDLGRAMLIRYVTVQVDNNDRYVVEKSLDGSNFSTLCTIESGYGDVGVGMDTMTSQPGLSDTVSELSFAPVNVRYVRIRATGGDNAYAVSELAVYDLETVDLASGQQDVTLQGGAAGDKLTWRYAIACGDVNGDGVQDLITGSPFADPLGRINAGEAYVVFGTPGISGVKDIGGINGDAPDVTIRGASEGDNLTLDFSLMIEDVNGDGIEDIIMGSPYADPDGRGDAGEIYVVYGSISLPPIIDLNIGTGSPHHDAAIEGAAASDRLTCDGAMAAGDVNGDGVHDILAGTRWASPGGRNQAGVAYVIYGSSSLPALIDLDTNTVLPHQDVTIQGAASPDYLTNGGSIRVADVNGDGIADILLGAYRADAAARVDAGAAYVIYGSAGLPSLIDLNTGSGWPHQNVTILGAQAGDLCSNSSFCHADVNGDGVEDLLLGAQGADPLGRTDAGAAYVIYGSASLPEIIDLNTGTGSTHQDITISGAAASDNLTYDGGIRAGDVNGDGIADVLLNAPFADPSGRTNAGAAYVVFGGEGIPSAIDLNMGTGSAHQNLTIAGTAANDNLGVNRAILAKDVNGDGIDDILLGAYLADPGGKSSAGAAYAIYGSASLPTAIDLNTGIAAVHQNLTILGSVANDNLTYFGAMAAADVNGDGVCDILLGTPHSDPSGRADAGAAYVIFGRKLYDSAVVRHHDHSLDPLGNDYGTARALLDYFSGSGPSLSTVTLTRNDTGVNMPDLLKVADVNWQVETDRTGFAADLTLHYLDSEIAGLDESKLAVYRSDAIDGTYTKVAGAVFNAARNRVTLSGLTGFSYFILTEDQDPPPPELPPCFLTSLLGLGSR